MVAELTCCFRVVYCFTEEYCDAGNCLSLLMTSNKVLELTDHISVLDNL